ncbi:MAG: hypothetical protein WBA16_10775 [Nonlabens sp.]
MKNVFLGIFIISLCSFATVDNELANDDCIHVTYSCGVETDICNFTGTTTQLVNMLIGQDNIVCGGKPIKTIKSAELKQV